MMHGEPTVRGTAWISSAISVPMALLIAHYLDPSIPKCALIGGACGFLCGVVVHTVRWKLYIRRISRWL